MKSLKHSSRLVNIIHEFLFSLERRKKNTNKINEQKSVTDFAIEK